MRQASQQHERQPARMPSTLDQGQPMSRLQRYLMAMAERYGRAPRRLTEYQQDLDESIARHPAGKRLE